MLMYHICSACAVDKKEGKKERKNERTNTTDYFHHVFIFATVSIFMNDNEMGGSKQKFYVSIFIRFTTIALCDLYL